MTAFRLLETPDSHMRTLRAYRTSFEEDRAKLNQLVQSNRRILDAATEAMIPGATEWQSRIEALRPEVEAATVDPIGPTVDTLFRELEQRAADHEINVPSDVKERYSLAIARYQLRASEMETLTRRLLDVNNDIASSLPRGQ